MIKRLLVLLVICFICNTLNCQENAVYHNLDNGYSIQYPNGWELEEDQDNGTITIYKNNQSSLIQTHLQISRALWEDGSLDEFVRAIHLEDMKDLYTDFSIKEQSKEEDKYMCEVSYLLNEVKVNSIFSFLKIDEQIFIFLAMAEDDKNYELDKEIFINIIDSIEFQN
jgi:hypothetical protein